MKKGRVAALLTVLCEEKDRKKLEKEIFLNSTSFGIRRQKMERTILKREFKSVEINGTKINVKFGYYEGNLVSKSYEYEDVKNLIIKENISYKEAVNLITNHLDSVKFL